MIDLTCPQCGNHVQVNVRASWQDWNEEIAEVEAWCCTAHPRPVRMVQTDPDPAP